MATDEHQVEVNGRRVRLTSLDRVLYPRTGTTKAEIVDYLVRIAPVLLPHLSRRPVTRKRWPEGVDGPSFFAKAIEPGAPGWIDRGRIQHSTGPKDYPLADEVATLVWFAQTASLELHVPQWRLDARGERCAPDRLVLDLDPGEGMGLAECAEVARHARGILKDVGLDTVPVTSGSKGLHLYARLDGSHGLSSGDRVSAFARELALALETDHPDLVVSRMARRERGSRVFVDWSQNNPSKTTISPYSLRGRAEPTVAAPRTWDELDAPDLRQLRFDEVLARAAEHGDLLAALAPADPLDRYRAKRTASRTPEPIPEAAVAPSGPSPLRFVVQEHHARRLHWDLRLERDGVLVSWAVPRGIPASTERNHLAVMTEPHPIEYLGFEGEIPEGEYGAGTMTVWDSGVYTSEKWRDDEVIMTLVGRPGGPLGEVRLALIRTAGDGEKSQWLLHRMQADAAPSSTRARSAGAAPSTALPSPMLATPATPALARTAAVRWGAWVEFKWDGVRALGEWDGQRLRLRARSGTDITARYPELTSAASCLGPDPLVVDGEIVAMDRHGRPSFTRLQNRMHLTKPREIEREAARTPVQYLLFDALRDDDRDLRAAPLSERRAVLDRRTRSVVLPFVVPPVAGDVDDALAVAEELGLEGIVVKNPASGYRPGARSDDWLKVKLTRTREVVVGGIRPGRAGRAGTIGSLLVGLPAPGGLRYLGRVGSGFGDRELARLADVLAPLRSDTSPFTDAPSDVAVDAVWVRPELVGEVAYAESSPAGILRHARWRGVRSDVSPDDLASGT